MRVLGSTGSRLALGSLILAVGLAASAADQIRARDRDQDQTQAHIEDQDRVRLNDPAVIPPADRLANAIQVREQVREAVLVRARAQARDVVGYPEFPGEGKTPFERIRERLRNLLRWRNTP